MATDTNPYATSSSSPPIQPGWRGVVHGNVLVVSLVSFFTDASSEMIMPLLPLFFTGLAVRHGYSAAAAVGMAAIYIGWMEGPAECVASILKIVAGRWSDRIGKRKVFTVAGYGLSSAIRPFIAIATAGWHVAVLRVFDRVGKGLRTSPRDALISDSVDPTVRGLAFSFHRTMDNAGAVLGPLIAVCILYRFLGGEVLWHAGAKDRVATPDEMHAMRWVFGIAVIPGILATMSLIRWVRDVAPKPKTTANGIDQTALPRKFYRFLTAVILFTLGNSSDLFFVLYSSELFGYGPLQQIALWVLLHFSKVIFGLPGGYLSDKLGRRATIVAGWSVYALVYVGMACILPLGGFLTRLGLAANVSGGQQLAFWLLIAIYGFYYGMSEGSEKALVADFVPSEHRGRAFGYYNGAIGVAALPGNLMFGVFWGFVGPYWAFGIGAGLATAATVLLISVLSADHKAVE
jgi:MFS family permease